MNKLNPVEQAKKEIEKESFRALVDKEKERLLAHKPFWHKVFPFKVTITWR